MLNKTIKYILKNKNEKGVKNKITITTFSRSNDWKSFIIFYTIVTWIKLSHLYTKLTKTQKYKLEA